MKKMVFFSILLSLSLVFSSIGLAQESEAKTLEAVEFLTGLGWGKVRVKGNYQQYPLMLDLDFNLKPLIQKLNLSYAPLLQFQLEPYIAAIAEPEANVETGSSFFFKIGILPQTSKFQPYIKFGTGISYMSLHTREQATQYNFISSGGIGMHYYFKKNMAFTIEGRYRHLSNLSIEHPNSGINTAFGLVGISYEF